MPKNNQLFIFPSWLLHSVSNNESDQERYSLAFNVYIKGKIGTQRISIRNKMTQAILPFLTAIALSGIAAYYSVIGLAQIFPGSFWPIIIMGTVLEIAKLVTVSWLYNN